MDRIGFIGAGNIGAPMARTLVRGQFNVTICDFNETVRRDFRDLGCATTDKARDVSACSAIIIMVNTAEQLQKTLFGSDGLVAGLREGDRPLVIVTSTIYPSVIEDIATKLMSVGIRMIDAPVSGGPIPAAQGKLTIMVGGKPADIEAAYPILRLLGSRIITCGTLGAGQKAKIINNLLGVTNQLIMAEALELAAKCGLGGVALLSAMDNSSGRNFWSRDWDMTRLQYTEYAQVADANLYVQRSFKDLDLGCKLATDLSIDVPILKSVALSTETLENRTISERFQSFKDI
jgi:3-hydroxyisobutyrate dehydrogenase